MSERFIEYEILSPLLNSESFTEWTIDVSVKRRNIPFIIELMSCFSAILAYP